MKQHGLRAVVRIVSIGTSLLDFLDSDRAKKRWGRWKGVRCLIAYAIWFLRFRNHPATRT